MRPLGFLLNVIFDPKGQQHNDECAYHTRKDYGYGYAIHLEFEMSVEDMNTSWIIELNF